MRPGCPSDAVHGFRPLTRQARECPGPAQGALLHARRSVKLIAVVVGLLAIFAVGSPAEAVTQFPLPAQTSPPSSVGTAQMGHGFPQLELDRNVPARATYTVTPGDTLSDIAYRFCASASAFPALAAASGLRDPDLIYPGQRITLNCAAAPAVAVASSVGVPVAAKPQPAPAQTSLAGGSTAAVVAYALAQVGKAYIWAAAGPNAFDCSGLVVAAYARIGIRLPHQSEELMQHGRVVGRSELAPGDVVMPFHGHVMIYIGNGRVVEAADPSQGVRTNSLYAFLTARRYVL